MLANEDSHAGVPYKLHQKLDDSAQLAEIMIGADGMLHLQGHTDVLKDDVVSRSSVLKNAAKTAGSGSKQHLPVGTNTVLLWLSVVKEDDRQLESLSAIQFARVLTVRTHNLAVIDVCDAFTFVQVVLPCGAAMHYPRNRCARHG